MLFVGRKEELKTLNRLYDSQSAEFVAVYGRRRVGKTALINEAFKGRITFMNTGIAPSEGNGNHVMSIQLDNFYASLIRHGWKGERKPCSWFEAFQTLEKYLESIDDGSRQVVFFDELPWMDTRKSNFIEAFESFWNSWGAFRDNLLVIVSGSANSWVQDKLINNHGGLYNRLTYTIKLSPFTLSECEEFYKAIGVNLSRYDITQSYMIFGGVPYYLRAFSNELSLAQNVDNLIFKKNAPFKNEYDRLFSSMFTNPEKEKAIVLLLSRRSSGYERDEIISKTGISDGGGLTKYLNVLVESDFVVKYTPFGEKKREERYKLIDPFCIFYLHFIVDKEQKSETFWETDVSSQSLSPWRGFAFENVCFNHIPQIKKALGISGVSTTESGWVRRDTSSPGTQVDLIISRRDNTINICELKFYSGEFAVDKNYYMTLLSRAEEVTKTAGKRATIMNTLITTFGLKRNEYSSVFTNTVTLDDLFTV